MASLKKRQKIALCSMMNFLAFHSRQVSLTMETQNYNLLLGVRLIVSIGSVHFVTNTGLVGRTYVGEVISEGDVVCYLKGGYSPLFLRSDGDTFVFLGSCILYRSVFRYHLRITSGFQIKPRCLDKCGTEAIQESNKVKFYACWQYRSIKDHCRRRAEVICVRVSLSLRWWLARPTSSKHTPLLIF